MRRARITRRSWTLLLFVALAWSEQSANTATAQPAPPEAGPGCTAATEKLPYPTYWLGPSFRGHEVSEVLLECQRGWTTITYLYGDCTPQGGGCALPLDIQNYPPELRNREMYAEGQILSGGPPGSPPPPPPPPSATGPRGTDTTIEGVPATGYGGHLDVYREETTVAIFSDVAPKIEIAEDLVEAPAIPATLSRFGLYFDGECIDTAGYCTADRSMTSRDIELFLGALLFYGMWFGVPFLAGLIFGRAWTFAVPLIVTGLYYVGASNGWIATGESWQYFLPYFAFGGMVTTLIGIGIHAALSSRKRPAA